MEILLAVIFGAAYGAVLHYLLPGRSLRGAALAPNLGAVVGGVTWLIGTWAGATTANPLLWILSLAVPVAVVPITLTLLRRAREQHDQRERVRRGIA